MKKSYLFILGTFNDVDHQTPVIWKMAKAGYPVRILFVDRNSNMDIEKDAHLRFLKKETGCSIEYYYSLKEHWLRLPNRPFIFLRNPLIAKGLRLLDSWMRRFVWTERWAESILTKINPALCNRR